MNLLYDGTFEGFLTLVHEVYYAKIKPLAIFKSSPKELLFEPLHEIFTDEHKATKVLHALKHRFSQKHFTRIFHTFLCDNEAFEIALLDFIILGFKAPQELENITIPSLFYLQRLEQGLLRLSHKMYGFTRFIETHDDTLYAKIETKHNVLPFLGEHFKKRLGNHRFIIHDIKRSLAYIKEDISTSIRHVSSFETPTHSEDEEAMQALWKTFFHHVAIENRRNETLQKSLTPLLYRTYMTEFQQ